mmetsp:Transcript_6378/g.11661  ORF Transcript_6378/g.11661 Transcript_6378/m.11661 type:complete len:202 (-) Transcript_6378:259-864(-)
MMPAAQAKRRRCPRGSCQHRPPAIFGRSWPLHSLRRRASASQRSHPGGPRQRQLLPAGQQHQGSLGMLRSGERCCHGHPPDRDWLSPGLGAPQSLRDLETRPSGGARHHPQPPGRGPRGLPVTALRSQSFQTRRPSTAPCSHWPHPRYLGAMASARSPRACSRHPLPRLEERHQSRPHPAPASSPTPVTPTRWGCEAQSHL